MYTSLRRNGAIASIGLSGIFVVACSSDPDLSTSTENIAAEQLVDDVNDNQTAPALGDESVAPVNQSDVTALETAASDFGSFTADVPTGIRESYGEFVTNVGGLVSKPADGALAVERCYASCTAVRGRAFEPAGFGDSAGGPR